MIIAIYHFLSFISAPALNFLLRKRVRAGKEDAKRIDERRGLASKQRPDGVLIWFHAASVGEAQSVLSLIDKIKDDNILITTGTVTSAKMLKKKLPANAVHQYYPMDNPLWVRRFLDYWKVDKIIWVESELWPNMLKEIRKRNIPAYLINGRMSEKSYKRWKKIPKEANILLSSFKEIISQSHEDAKRLDALYGKKTHLFGNIKYLATPLPYNQNDLDNLSANIRGRKKWLYASTHKGEEEIAARIHAKLKNKYPDLLTIIIPRHPERSKDIVNSINNDKLEIALRSSTGNNISLNTDIYIADSLGELGLFYKICDIAVIGRSLSNDGGGGHNPIEAAQLGCVIIHGKNVKNLQEIYDDFAQSNTSIQVDGEEDLYKWIDILLGDEAMCNEYIKCSKKLIEQKRGNINKIRELTGI